MFTIEGLGGEDLVNSNSEIGSGSITTNYPNGPLSAIGFKDFQKFSKLDTFAIFQEGHICRQMNPHPLESWILFLCLVQEKFYPKLIT